MTRSSTSWGGSCPQERIAYLNAERTGRGRAPAVPRTLRARLLSEVIEPYIGMKAKDGSVDWNDVAVEAASAGSRRYDVVVVDETQDLSANQVRAILHHLQEDHTTTFITDAMQRIYPQSFRWQEVGIEVRPQMVFTLAENHRNTSQTAHLASSLVADIPVEEDGVPPDAKSCRRTGEVPQVIVGRYSAQIQYMLDRLAPFLGAGETVAILQPRGGGWFDFVKKALRERQYRLLCSDASQRMAEGRGTGGVVNPSLSQGSGVRSCVATWTQQRGHATRRRGGRWRPGRTTPVGRDGYRAGAKQCDDRLQARQKSLPLSSSSRRKPTSW